jgi:predicted RNase H-like HicB family nuclease
MENYAYAVRVEKGEDGSFRVVVPALDCTADGETYAEALVAAREAIEQHLELLWFRGMPIPLEDHGETAQVVIAAEPLFPPDDLSPGQSWGGGRGRSVSFGTGTARWTDRSVGDGGEEA